MIGWASAALALIGAFFFLAGTVGLLRFPDVYCRLHALTKADNLGLGFIVLALAITSESLAVAAKLVLIWGLTLAAAATAAYLVANGALSRGVHGAVAPDGSGFGGGGAAGGGPSNGDGQPSQQGGDGHDRGDAD